MRKIAVIGVLSIVLLGGCSQAGTSQSGVPQACLEAVKASDKIMEATMESLEVTGEMIREIPSAMEAAGRGYAPGMNSLADKLDKVSEKSNRAADVADSSGYESYRAECLGE